MARLPDLLTEDLDVVFCGINPAQSAARAGHHFSSRSNRFWRVLHLAGFTPHLIQPESDCTILQYGCGLTAAVERPTVRASELMSHEFHAAAREGKLPFPDGAIIAALHCRNVASEENNKVFGQAQSFVPGPPTNIQFMVKDSKKYAAIGGWGFAHFADGKPGDAAFMKSCFPCHAKTKATDLVFTRYAP